jgi:hypothetical protein
MQKQMSNGTVNEWWTPDGGVRGHTHHWPEWKHAGRKSSAASGYYILQAAAMKNRQALPVSRFVYDRD